MDGVPAPLWPGHCNPNDEDDNATAAECSRNLRRDAAAGTGRKRQDNEADYIRELVQKYQTPTVGSFINALTQEEFDTLYTLTPNFKERVKVIITFEEAQKLKRRKTTRFWATYEENHGNFEQEQEVAAGSTWLNTLCTIKGFSIAELLAWVEVIADKFLNKTNTLLLFGPITTGKTLIVTSLLELHEPTKLSAMNNASPFYLAQLTNSHLDCMKEWTISEVNKDDFKKLLGGEKMHIAVKYENHPEILERSPSLRQPTTRWAGSNLKQTEPQSRVAPRRST